MKLPADFIWFQGSSPLAFSRSRGGLSFLHPDALLVVRALTEGLDEENVSAIGERSCLSPARTEEVLSDLRQVFCALPVDRARPSWPQLVRSLRLNLTTDCNMNCGHCYISRAWRHCETDWMPFHIAERAVEWFAQAHCSIDEALSLRLFGGEPTLDWVLVQRVLRFAREKLGDRTRLILNTNGTRITSEAATMLAEQRVHVIVSLDSADSSSPAFHNEQDRVLQGLGELVEGHCSVAVSSVVGPGWDGENLIRDLAKLGVREVGINEPRFGARMDEQAGGRTAEQVFAAWKLGAELGVQVGGEWRWVLNRLPLHATATGDYCDGWGSEASVMPDGSVYACAASQRRLGRVDQRGLVLDEGVQPSETQELPADCTVCDIEYACRGGCRADSEWHGNEGPSAVGCSFRRAIVSRFLTYFADVPLSADAIGTVQRGVQDPAQQ